MDLAQTEELKNLAHPWADTVDTRKARKGVNTERLPPKSYVFSLKRLSVEFLCKPILPIDSHPIPDSTLANS